MDIVKIIMIGIISAVLAISMKQYNPQFVVVINLCAGILIFTSIFPYLSNTITDIHGISKLMYAKISHIDILLKIIGISYICEFASQICADSGQSAIASKIEFGGKILIMSISLPIFKELINLISSIIL